MELQELRVTAEGLRPIRRMLDKFQSAVDLATELDQDLASRKAKVERYAAKVRDLQGEILALTDQQQVAQEATDKELAAMQSAKYLAAAELVVYREGLEKEQAAMLKTADEQRLAIRAEHDSYMQALQREKQVATADYERLIAAVEALKGQLKGLL